MKFSIGDLVVEKELIQPYTSYPVNVVICYLNGAVLTENYGYGIGDDVESNDDELKEMLSKPGSRSWKQGLQRFQKEELLLIDAAQRELHRLEQAKDKMEAEFDGIKLSLKSKMEQAAALVKEAVAIVKPLDKSFYDLRKECMPLFKALNDGGWSHSSMRC